MLYLKFFLVFVLPALALQLEVQRTLPSKLTQVNISKYDIYGNGQGATSFILNLRNPERKAYEGLSIEYEISYRINGDDQFSTIYKGISNKFDLRSDQILISETSGEFLLKKNPNVLFSKEKSIEYESYESVRNRILNKILETGNLVSGIIKIQANLLNPKKISISKSETSSEILNVNNLQLVYPVNGTSVYVENPQFIWISDLQNDMYKDFIEPIVFEFYLYEQKINQQKNQALIRETYKSETTINNLLYPISEKKLNPSSVYYWKVMGVLRGAGKTLFESEIQSFRFVEPIKKDDPEARLILEQLKSLLLDERFKDYLKELEGFLHHVEGRIANKTIGIDELKGFLNKITSGEFKIEKIYIK